VHVFGAIPSIIHIRFLFVQLFVLAEGAAARFFAVNLVDPIRDLCAI